ncbi:hypothetical protein JAGODDHD_04371 [Sphingomonas paucimobilis]|nr:hypothetical protein [Sphingomonas paucimobilis]
MEHIELTFDPLGDAVLLALERGDAAIGVDRDQVGLKPEIDTVLLDIFHQRRDVGRDPEQGCAGIMELDVDSWENAAIPPDVAGEIHRFLRCAGALDRHGWLREQRPPLPQFLDELVGVGCQIVAIVGGDAVAAESLRQPFDLLPRQAQPGRDDQNAIGQCVTVFELDRVTVGVDGNGGQPYPLNALWHYVGFGLARLFGSEDAGPHHRPAGLVIMVGRRIDDRDRHFGVALQNAGSGRDAGGTAPDDDDVVGH